MPKVNLETTQNVFLELEIASVGERIIAAFLDRVIMFLYIGFMVWFLGSIGVSLDNDENLYYVWMFFFSLPVFFFALAQDIVSNGQSLGKKAMKMRVIKTDGTTPSIGDFILRWMLRLVDLYFVIILMLLSGNDVLQGVGAFFMIVTAPVVGVFFMIKSENSQRLGDLASDTIVVKKTRRVTLEDTVLPLLIKKYTPRFLNVLELNDRDVRIIKEVIDNSVPGEQEGIVKKLAGKAQQILSIQTKMSPRKFLYTLMKDYSYLAMEESKKSTKY
jgi:uncharacterized RDD family membrane protein YckC